MVLKPAFSGKVGIVIKDKKCQFLIGMVLKRDKQSCMYQRGCQKWCQFLIGMVLKLLTS